MAKQGADKGNEEAALEAQWNGICRALEPFLRGESTDSVFVLQRMHPMTMQHLRDTYELDVSEWMGFHTIRRMRVKKCDNGHDNQCLLKCTCPNIATL